MLEKQKLVIDLAETVLKYRDCRCRISVVTGEHIQCLACKAKAVLKEYKPEEEPELEDEDIF